MELRDLKTKLEMLVDSLQGDASCLEMLRFVFCVFSLGVSVARGIWFLELQVYREYVLRDLKYISRTYFWLFGA